MSHWGLRSWKGVETRTFAQAVEDELGAGWMDDPAGVGEKRCATTASRGRREAAAGATGPGRGRKRSSARAPEKYVARGVYVDQLKRWHAVFPREQLLVLESEAFFADPPAVFDEVCDHLGIPRVPPKPPKHRHGNQRPREAEPEVVEALRVLYRAPNRRLAEYLGREFSWSSASAIERRRRRCCDSSRGAACWLAHHDVDEPAGHVDDLDHGLALQVCLHLGPCHHQRLDLGL